jgi:hypothetical protein
VIVREPDESLKLHYQMNAIFTCGALLFDLDGVLIDSTLAVARVWTQWAIEH